jgi:deoxyguanosine kinase
MPERGEKLSNERYPFIAVVGPVGVGKSTFTELIATGIGITQFQEPYRENPYLKDFYLRSPADFSFDTQMFFLANKGLQVRKIEGLAKAGPVIQDPGIDVDFMIASAQHDMHWMTHTQFDTYKSAFVNVFADSLVPDIYIALKAKPDTVIKRIKGRGREMELAMHEKYPEYFSMLARKFDKWLSHKRKQRGNWIVEIDTDRFDFTGGDDIKESVVKEAINWTNYLLTNPNQRNTIGSDGAKLIIPRSFRITRHFVDPVPGANINY